MAAVTIVNNIWCCEPASVGDSMRMRYEKELPSFLYPFLVNFNLNLFSSFEY